MKQESKLQVKLREWFYGNIQDITKNSITVRFVDSKGIESIAEILIKQFPIKQQKWIKLGHFVLFLISEVSYGKYKRVTSHISVLKPQKWTKKEIKEIKRLSKEMEDYFKEITDE